MDTALPHIFPFILDRNFAKPNWTGNRVYTSCDIVVFASKIFFNLSQPHERFSSSDTWFVILFSFKLPYSLIYVYSFRDFWNFDSDYTWIRSFQIAFMT